MHARKAVDIHLLSKISQQWIFKYTATFQGVFLHMLVG